MKNRRENLMEVIEDVDDNKKELLGPLIDEIVYLEEQMEYLKSLPQIKLHPKDPSIQKLTEASKQYKILSQSYMNAIRIILSTLKNHEENEQNALLAKLAEFTT